MPGDASWSPLEQKRLEAQLAGFRPDQESLEEFIARIAPQFPDHLPAVVLRKAKALTNPDTSDRSGNLQGHWPKEQVDVLDSILREELQKDPNVSIWSLAPRVTPLFAPKTLVAVRQKMYVRVGFVKAAMSGNPTPLEQALSPDSGPVSQAPALPPIPVSVEDATTRLLENLSWLSDQARHAEDLSQVVAKALDLLEHFDVRAAIDLLKKHNTSQE